MCMFLCNNTESVHLSYCRIHVFFPGQISVELRVRVCVCSYAIIYGPLVCLSICDLIEWVHACMSVYASRHQQSHFVCLSVI